MSNVLADRLLLCRRDVGITQIELANRAGNLSAAYISDLERNKVSNPTVEVIQTIANALGVKPEYLLGWTDDPLGEGETVSSAADGRIVYQVASSGEYRAIQQLLDIWPELPEEDQRFLLELAAKLGRAKNVRIIE